jgi:DNA-binding NarL/FixJ family response regulator
MAYMADERLRVVVADDHAGVLEEIRRLLESEFEIVRAVRGGLELLKATAEIRPDAVVSDIAMPDLDGIEAGRQIVARGESGAVLVVTMHNDPDLVQRAADVGIRGFVLKVDIGDELIGAVRAVAGGGCYVSRSVRTG